MINYEFIVDTMNSYLPRIQMQAAIQNRKQSAGSDSLPVTRSPEACWLSQASLVPSSGSSGAWPGPGLLGPGTDDKVRVTVLHTVLVNLLLMIMIDT
jgi:hypothetical protein